jgi:hypothetical protein
MTKLQQKQLHLLSLLPSANCFTKSTLTDRRKEESPPSVIYLILASMIQLLYHNLFRKMLCFLRRFNASQPPASPHATRPCEGHIKPHKQTGHHHLPYLLTSSLPSTYFPISFSYLTRAEHPSTMGSSAPATTVSPSSPPPPVTPHAPPTFSFPCSSYRLPLLARPPDEVNCDAGRR